MREQKDPSCRPSRRGSVPIQQAEKRKKEQSVTWAKAKLRRVSEAKYCRRYSLARARACSRTGKAMVWHRDCQYSSATASRTLQPRDRRRNREEESELGPYLTFPRDVQIKHCAFLERCRAWFDCGWPLSVCLQSSSLTNTEASKHILCL